MAICMMKRSMTSGTKLNLHTAGRYGACCTGKLCHVAKEHLWCVYRYRMDYMKFVEHHRVTDADITIGCLPVDYERASDFGLMKINEEGRIMVSVLLQKLCIAAIGMDKTAVGT